MPGASREHVCTGSPHPPRLCLAAPALLYLLALPASMVPGFITHGASACIAFLHDVSPTTNPASVPGLILLHPLPWVSALHATFPSLAKPTPVGNVAHLLPLALPPGPQPHCAPPTQCHPSCQQPPGACWTIPGWFFISGGTHFQGLTDLGLKPG